MNTMTGFELAALATEKLGRNVRPQMVYNYIKKGRIETVTVNGKDRVTVEEAAKFIRSLADGVTVDRKVRRLELSSAIDELLEG